MTQLIHTRLPGSVLYSSRTTPQNGKLDLDDLEGHLSDRPTLQTVKTHVGEDVSALVHLHLPRKHTGRVHEGDVLKERGRGDSRVQLVQEPSKNEGGRRQQR